MQGIRVPDLASAHPRGLLQSFYILGNPEAQKSPSLITDLAGEQLEALCASTISVFSHMPHSLFLLTHGSHTNAITFQKDIYNLRHPSDQHFPVTFSPYQLAAEFFHVNVLTKIFLRLPSVA